GGGTGRLAADVLAALAGLGRLPRRYLILELSPELRERQRAHLAAQVPALLARVEWVREPPAGFAGVVLANEVLDALPVELFALAADGTLAQRCVTYRDGALGWLDRAPPPELA